MLFHREEIIELCDRIEAEQDSAKLVVMLDELRTLLASDLGETRLPVEIHRLREQWSAAKKINSALSN